MDPDDPVGRRRTYDRSGIVQKFGVDTLRQVTDGLPIDKTRKQEHTERKDGRKRDRPAESGRGEEFKRAHVTRIRFRARCE